MSDDTETLEDAVIYTRVSSKKQVKQGHGLDSQEVRCREYAGYARRRVIAVFQDDVSGGSKDRPGITNLLKFLRTHRREGIIVIIDDITRFARDVRGHWDLRDLLTEAGGKLESPSIKFGEDADSILHENLMASVSQHQRQKNTEQTKNRMRARVQAGFWVFQAPKGYRYENIRGQGKTLVRHEPYASIIAEALEGFASGRFETLVEVKRFLESRPAWPKDKRGEVHQERIIELFSRPTYAGYITIPQWGLSLVPAKHEPLVSLQTWLAVQERQHGKPRAPTRKDLSADFPLRNFVTCGHCGEALTSCWSKGRSARYPYYLCDTRGCVAYRKSIRKEVIEGEFEALLMLLQPSEGLFNLAFQMFRDLWDLKTASAGEQSQTMKREIAEAERKIDQLLERMVEASSDLVVAAYEKKIHELQTRKALLNDQLSSSGKPQRDFGETYRTAFDFLASPWKLWRSPRIEDRRAVLKLVFAERLPYVRGEGYRTAQLSTPFKMLGDMNMSRKKMVRAVGILH